jgi:hypothetical protein
MGAGLEAVKFAATRKIKLITYRNALGNIFWLSRKAAPSGGLFVCPFYQALPLNACLEKSWRSPQLQLSPPPYLARQALPV